MTVLSSLAGRFIAAVAIVLLTGSLGFSWASSQGSLRVESGVVVKFGLDARLEVSSRLSAGANTVFTSLYDNTVLGALSQNGQAAQPGDWQGVGVLSSSASVEAQGLEVRYATMGLGPLQSDALLTNMVLRDNVLGLGVAGQVAPTLRRIRLTSNDVGLDVTGGATPSIDSSHFTGNAAFAAFTDDPNNLIAARNNWWGDASGPYHPTLNPLALGDVVSDGVAFTPWLTTMPLVGCSVRLADGQYVRNDAAIQLALSCPGAEQVQVSESSAFAGAASHAYSTSLAYQLSSSPGEKQLYVAFSRGTQRSVKALPRAIRYRMTWPTVRFVQPLEGSTVEESINAQAHVDAPLGFQHATFYLNGDELGVDSELPAEFTLDINSVQPGPAELLVVVEDRSGNEVSATVHFTIDPRVVDTTPPAILNLAYGGNTLSDGMTWRSANALAFSAEDDLGAVASASVSLRGEALSGLARSGDDFSLAIDRNLVDNGPAQLEIRATDDSGNTAVADYAIQLALGDANAPYPRDDQYSGEQGQTLTIPAPGVLENDDLPVAIDDIEITSQPFNGTISIDAGGGFAFIPDTGFYGDDRFRYRLHASGTTSREAEVTLSLSPANRAPNPANDQYSTVPDVSLSIAAPGVLANDTDPDGDTLTARLVDGPDNGDLTLAASGGFEFQPAAGFTGTDSFTYEAVDNEGLANTASVELRVQGNPVAVDDQYQGREDQALAIAAEWGVLANDELNGQAVRAEVVSQPNNAQLSFADDGSFLLTPSEQFNGTVSFAYVLKSGSNQSPPATVSVLFEPVNDEPLARQDRYLLDYESELAVSSEDGLLSNDSDIDNDPLLVGLAREPQHGRLELLPDGGFVYLPNSGFLGEDVFRYAVEDGNGGRAEADVVLHVTPGPMALNDVYFLDPGERLEIGAPGVLGNDFHKPQGSVLTATLVTPPSNGSATLEQDGSLIYQPEDGFEGVDYIEYRANAEYSESGIASITLAVGTTSFPIASNDEGFEGMQGEVTNFQTSLLDNDIEPNGLAMTASFVPRSIVPGKQNISVAVNDDGTFSVDPGNRFRGDMSFKYVAFNDLQISNEATVTVTIHPTNNGVEVSDDEYGVVPGETLRVSEQDGVLDNDFSDLLYGELRAILVTPPGKGNVTLNTDGSFVYEPGSFFTGRDVFTYRAEQTAGAESAIGEVVIVSNRPPVVPPFELTLEEDTVYDFGALANPLANATDPDGDDITINDRGRGFPRCFLSSAWFSFCFEEDGTLSAETRKNFFGELKFYFDATDGIDTVRVPMSVTVLPEPDAPDPLADRYVVAPEKLADITPEKGVLSNDRDPDKIFERYNGFDPDTAPTRARLVNGPANGSLDLDADGGFRFQPDSGFAGEDGFTYEAFDGTGLATEESVRLIVNDAPSGVSDFYDVNEDTELVVQTPGVLGNDIDSDHDIAELRAYRTSIGGCAPCHGELRLSRSGYFVYTPDPDFFGEDTFYYRVRDGISTSDATEVTIRVQAVNDPPAPESDLYRLDQDSVLIVPPSYGVIINDEEVDGDPINVTGVVEEPNHGNVSLQADGSFTYTPDELFHGEDRFRYRVEDNAGLGAEATVTLLVRHINSAPQAGEDRYTVEAGSTLEVTAADGILANDTDVDGDSLRVHLVRAPAEGALSLNPDGGFRFEAPDGPSRSLTWAYQLRDGKGGIDAGTVTIDIINTDQPATPVLVDDQYLLQGSPLIVDAFEGVLSNDEHIGSHTVVLLEGPTEGSLDLASDGGFVFNAPGALGQAQQFRYGLANVAGSSATVTIDVPAQSDPLQARDNRFTLMGEGERSVPAPGVMANDLATDAQAVLSEAPPTADGTLTLELNGAFQFTPADDFQGTTRFAYHLARGTERSSDATVELVIPGPQTPPAGEDASWPVFGVEGDALPTMPLPELFAGFPAQSLRFIVEQTPQIDGVTTSVDDNGGLLVTLPSAAWEGQITLQVRAENDHGTSDPVTLVLTISRALFADGFETRPTP